jgi:LAS superfamily LD-carboxypeptidase LdcB
VSDLTDLLYTEQQRMDSIADSIEGVDSTVGKLSGSVRTLEKITTTDPQLLQKYSRVYFLNEHYMPADLVIIDEKFDLIDGKQVTVHADMWPFLSELLTDADDDGIDIMVLSGYRSFAEQASIKQNYVQRYGTGANQFSADQGYSEHQLGTTVDFTTKGTEGDLARFENTEAFAWLKDNAYRYGFTMSYPENNEYYIYEPWHWRFVGKDLARHLHRNDLHFYSMEQREIEKYIPTLFDN